MYPPVIKVLPLTDYQLQLTFQNGEEGIFDMKPYLSLPIFQPLNDLLMFNKVRVCFDTIAWEGDIDIDPETLYNGCEKQVASISTFA